MVKILKEILSIVNEIKFYIEDLIKFISSPKEYLIKIENETNYGTVKRIFIYALIFSIIEYILFSNLDEFNYLKILKLSIFETVISLSPFPIIFLQFYLLKSAKKLKSAIIYCLSFRFTYLLIPITFYSLFLNTELYFFIIIGSISVFLYILYLFFKLPIIYSVKFKRKIIIFAATLVATLLWFVPIGFLISSFPLDRQKIIQSSLLFDPIRNEVQKEILEGYNWELDIKFDKFISTNRNKFYNYIIEQKKGNKAHIIEDSSHIYNLIKDSEALFTEYISRKKETEDLLEQLRFNSTKEFISLKLLDINCRITYLKYIPNYFDGNISINEMNLSIEAYDINEKNFIESLGVYINNTNILRRYLIIMF